MTDKHAPRRPNPVDVHVGTRIRLRRQIMKMSQEKLGDELGVTFQQVQKYERGANRVGASRLHKMSDTLKVPVGYFFEGLNSDAAEAADEAVTLADEFIQSTDGVNFMTAVMDIKKPEIRRQALALVRSLATA